MSKKKAITLLLTLAMILSLAVSASAAETTAARVPVTLTVVNTVSPISCTVPACLPVSLVDGYVVCANNAAILERSAQLKSQRLTCRQVRLKSEILTILAQAKTASH